MVAFESDKVELGMRAKEYRAGGVGAVIRFAVGQCSLGAILIAQSQRGIRSIHERIESVREIADRAHERLNSHLEKNQ